MRLFNEEFSVEVELSERVLIYKNAITGSIIERYAINGHEHFTKTYEELTNTGYEELVNFTVFTTNLNTNEVVSELDFDTLEDAEKFVKGAKENRDTDALSYKIVDNRLERDKKAIVKHLNNTTDWSEVVETYENNTYIMYEVANVNFTYVIYAKEIGKLTHVGTYSSERAKLVKELLKK